jgi:hypothetical protein
MIQTIVNLDIPLHDFQRDFMLCTTPDQLFAGGSGIGKTYAASLKIVKYMLEHPKSEAMCAAAIWASTQNIVVKNILEWLERIPNTVYNHQKGNNLIQFNNGSIIHFMNLQNPGSLKSYNIDIIWVEEGIEVADPEAIFEQLQNRLRTKFDYPKQLIITTNPGLKSHYLYKKFYVNNTEKQWAITLPATAGKHHPQSYFDRLAELSPDRREMLYEGNWGSVQGAAIHLTKDHVCEFEEEGEWRYYLTFDYGYAPDPGCWLLMGEHERTVYVIDELEFYQTPAVKQLPRLTEMINGRPVYYFTGEVASGSGEYRSLIKDNFKSYFIAPVKDRYYGWRTLVDTIETRLDDDRVCIKIHPRCKRTIESLESLLWMPNKMDIMSINGDDHFADALRYFLTSKLYEKKYVKNKIILSQKRFTKYYN